MSAPTIHPIRANRVAALWELKNLFAPCPKTIELEFTFFKNNRFGITNTTWTKPFSQGWVGLDPWGRVWVVGGYVVCERRCWLGGGVV